MFIYKYDFNNIKQENIKLNKICDDKTIVLVHGFTKNIEDNLEQIIPTNTIELCLLFYCNGSIVKI